MEVSIRYSDEEKAFFRKCLEENLMIRYPCEKHCSVRDIPSCTGCNSYKIWNDVQGPKLRKLMDLGLYDSYKDIVEFKEILNKLKEDIYDACSTYTKLLNDSNIDFVKDDIESLISDDVLDCFNKLDNQNNNIKLDGLDFNNQ